MKVIKSDNLIYYDCDDTLVIWNSPLEVRHASIEFDNYGWNERLVPNFRMIDNLKRNHEQGATIIVWSQNGYQWANEIVLKLKLEKWVDMVQSKPKVIFDDIPPQEFIKRAFVAPDWLDARYNYAPEDSKEEG